MFDDTERHGEGFVPRECLEQLRKILQARSSLNEMHAFGLFVFRIAPSVDPTPIGVDVPAEIALTRVYCDFSDLSYIAKLVQQWAEEVLAGVPQEEEEPIKEYRQ